MAGITQTIQNTANQAQAAAAAAAPKATSVASLAGSTPQMPQQGVAYSPINPSSDLRSQTIGVGPTADRNQIAQNQINTWNASTEPQYQADLRSATSQAAGAGQLGSGQLRTSLGNAAYNRDLQRNSAEQGYLQAAQTGSIQDAYNNVGIAQQQQARQDSAQNQSFNQAATTLQLGNSGNPSTAYTDFANMYGANAQAGQSGLSSLINNTAANNTAAANNAAYQKVLQQYGIPGNSTTPTTSLPQGSILNYAGGSYS